MASLGFYAVWDPRYLVLLLGSIVCNFLTGRELARNDGLWAGRRRMLLIVMISANLLALGYFKYANFLVDNVNWSTGAGFDFTRVILPLGISFFTFTQIAYLVDVYRQQARESSFLHYLLFVTYFPHLIAGPILHHAEMMPQFGRAETYRPHAERFVTGLAIFAIGLAKKVVLADGIAVYVAPVFGMADRGGYPPLADAWGGALAYTFQLYFDFSGYCDMAIGISWMFGIALPINFNSPYKATSVIDFWRRWHMTLSRFLRDYLYIPLGGNRRGAFRRYANLFATMAIGGLWHGAGWTFVIWGALHGVYLMVNHAASHARRRWPLPDWGVAGTFLSWLLTFLAVLVGWVFFRAESVEGALRVLTGMVGANGCVLPRGLLGCSSAVETAYSGVMYAHVFSWSIALMGVALLLPNTQEIMRDQLSGITRPDDPALEGDERMPIRFRRSIAWVAFTSVLLAAGLINLPQPTSFLYFNF